MPRKVEVCEPQSSGGFRSHTTYLVRSPQRDASVRRRYSDFDWLRDMLADKYVGMYLPPLPPKKVNLAQDEDFVQDRVRFLNMFMSDLVAVPYLVDDNLLEAFLTLPNGREFDNFKKGYEQQDNAGLARWFDALDAMEAPGNPEASIESIRTEMDLISKELATAVAASHKLRLAAQQYSASIAEMQRSLANLQASHYNTSQSLADSARQVAESHEAQHQHLTLLDAAVGVWAQQSTLQEPEMSLFITDALKRQLVHIDAIRSLLAARDSILSAYNRATNQRDGLELQLQQLQGNPKAKPERVDKVKEQLAEASTTVDAMLVKVNRATKGVLLVELPRAEQEFSQELRSAAGQFAAVHLASNQRLRQAWQRLIADLGFELSTLAPNTRESLESGTIVKTTSGNPFASEHTDAGASAGAADAPSDSGGQASTEAATRAMEDVEL